MKIRYFPFEKLPYTDTCWSLIEGPDERVYAAACCEFSSGGTAYVIRYDPRTEELDYVIDVADAVGQPPSNGRASQCKIHYSMVASDDGILYGATHLSGPAITEIKYDPWGSFDDPLRSYVGARLFAYDIASEEVLWADTLIPWEGCRCLALDQERNRLYAVGYPRDHFYVYDLATHERRDLGRIGSVNPQAIWLDKRMRAYTLGDYGEMLVYDPETEKLLTTDIVAPHAPYQNGWHNVPYDVVQVPGKDEVIGVSWNADPYLFRFQPGEEAGTGQMEDLGPTRPGVDGTAPRGTNEDHAGGLVFAADGSLFFVQSLDVQEKEHKVRGAMLKRMDLETRETSDMGWLRDQDDNLINYISRAVRIGAEHLVMGIVGRLPTGIVHVVLDDDLTKGPHEQPLRRYWG